MEWSEVSLATKIVAILVTALALGLTGYVFLWRRL